MWLCGVLLVLVGWVKCWLKARLGMKARSGLVGLTASCSGERAASCSGDNWAMPPNMFLVAVDVGCTSPDPGLCLGILVKPLLHVL